MNQKLQILFSGETSLRLDKHLKDLNIQELYSRSFIERLIQEDRILVNNIPVKKSYILHHNDEIVINLPPPEPKDITPQNIPLDVIYEDDDLAVINKAPGMIVHPGFGNPDSTLVNAILYRFGANLSSGKEINRPGIVHRLDRGTSGLMIIAKNDPAQALLSDMFARREIEKIYLAITTGVPEEEKGSIETYISRCVSNPRKMCVADTGKWALTHYEVLKFYHCFALVKVRLETGRMHQIRVHFSHINYPILGDLLYNTRNQVLASVPQNMKKKAYDFLSTNLQRQALHAWSLRFVHPVSKRLIHLYGDPPEDFLKTLEWLDNHFSVDNQTTDISLIRNNIESIENDK